MIKKLLFITALAIIYPSFASASDLKLERINVYESKNECKKTEIVSIQAKSKRIALSCGDKGIVEVLSIEIPSKPTLLNTFKIANEEEISSIAFHPTENIIAAAVLNNDPFSNGSIQLHDANTGKIINTLDAGVHPDGLAFSPNGKYLVIANEGEAYRYNGKEYESPEGSVTLIDFDSVTESKAIQIKLDDYSQIQGMLHKKHERKFEREVIGGNSEEEIKISIKDNTPANTEPEFVTFSPDNTKAYVSLQENNGILVIDTATAKIESVFGLGITEHLADIKDDGKIQFKSTLTALREPDGISITPDGRYLLTADEGDTDPKASKTRGKKPAGGGRTMSVFDANSGEFIADTGNQLDEMAHAVGLYPDDRSDNKGSEPENVVSFEINDTTYAAVGLERANAIALISLADPAKPKVINVEGVDIEANQGKYAPEGLAYYQSDKRHFIFSANEKSGTMTVMEVK